MNDNTQELFGSWIQAIGTLIDASSSTPYYELNERSQSDLIIIGNVMQATGNGLIVDTGEAFSIEQIGGAIESLGNITVVAAILFELDDKAEIELTIKGHLLQALGSLLPPFYLTGDDKAFDKDEMLLNLGSILQAIGSIMQAWAGFQALHAKDGEKIDSLGGWIQASGAVLQALVVSKNQFEFDREGK
ncbi:hypothetical protein KGF86_10510 [Ornithinibacillus massiliensis]|nr:hypothetical protein [Ornithinibacillus massiliensis]MBS3680648.1 hypothetical protein [Ornithinibacillus massiliensis]